MYRVVILLLFHLSLFSQETIHQEQCVFPSLYDLVFNNVLDFIATKKMAKDQLALLPTELTERIKTAMVPFKKSIKKFKKCNSERQILLHCLQEDISEKIFLDVDVILKFKRLFIAAIPHEIGDMVATISQEKIHLDLEDITNIVSIRAGVGLKRKIALQTNFFNNLLWKIVYDGKGSIDKTLIYSSCYEKQNNLLTAQVLILLGANVTAQMELAEYENRVFSPLSMATYNNDQEIVTLLKHHGAHDNDIGKNV